MQIGSGIIYVSASHKGADFGSRLAEALQLPDQLPNPVRLLYDYALQLGHGKKSLLCYIGSSGQ